MRLKGLKKVTRRLASGKVEVYWYAWSGGPRLTGAPGSPEFLKSYQDAVEARRAPTTATLAALVAKFRASPEFGKFAASTKREWSRWLDQIASSSGDLALGGAPLEAFDDRHIKSDILDWRDQWGATPRAADYAIQVLSRVLAYGVSRGELALNMAEGVSKLYEGDRSMIIWTPEEIAEYERLASSPEVSFIVPLASMTALRREDLSKLAWSHVGDFAIIIETGKGRGKRTAVIPLLRETRALLARIKAHRPNTATILTNTFGKQWTPSGLSHAVHDIVAEMGADLHLHDARGTFATRLRHATRTASQIADVMGWSEERVERILKKYVNRNAIVLEIARAMNESTPILENGLENAESEIG